MSVRQYWRGKAGRGDDGRRKWKRAGWRWNTRFIFLNKWKVYKCKWRKIQTRAGWRMEMEHEVDIKETMVKIQKYKD